MERRTLSERFQEFKEDYKKDYRTRRRIGNMTEYIGIFCMIGSYDSFMQLQKGWKNAVPFLASAALYAFGQSIRNFAIRDEALDAVKKEKEEREKKEKELEGRI
ncbi:MAG: hypothetical protein Q7S06_01180 [Nanoarchaeota archaeon]|nr:hypothetical protein [Nanoarchaeota archaeon]